MNLRKPLLTALVPAALLALQACSSEPKAPPPPESDSSISYVEGVPGAVFVRTAKSTARVSYVNKEDRKIILVTSDGKKTDFTAGPEVANFDQIRVGDELSISLAEELAWRLAGDAEPARDGQAAVVALAPLGAKPALLVADTVQMTATVTAINHERHEATLRFPGGEHRTFPVRPDVDLTKHRVGEEMIVRSTVAVLIEVTTP